MQRMILSLVVTMTVLATHKLKALAQLAVLTVST